jgi:hypothetical protein
MIFAYVIVGTLQTGYLYIQVSRQYKGRASTQCHLPYGSGSHLPAEVDSGAATYTMAPDLVSKLRWALAAATCHMAPDLAYRLR